MASKGAHVSGTDGSDSGYRMQVAAQYSTAAELKRRLAQCDAVQWLYCLAVAAELLLLQSQRLGYPVLLAALLPLLGRHGRQHNRTVLLTLYCLLLACFAALLLYAGLGRTLMAMQDQQWQMTPHAVFAVAVDAVGVAVHLYASFVARALLSMLVELDGIQRRKTAVAAAKKSGKGN